jgi:hypothetical protein
MTDGRDEVTDRLASRFEQEAEAEERAGDEVSSQNATNATNATNGKREGKVPNVKNAWNAKSIYLPDDLDRDLTREYKRLDLELDGELDGFKKTRHFYPLVIAAGLERLDGMERDELMERIERIE